MSKRKKKGKVMNKVRHVNKANTAKRQKQIAKNMEIVRSPS